MSDVHANLAALEAVLAAIDAGDADELWCLGDLVGYGPDPEACVARVLERAATCLAGNHDLVVAGSIDLDVFAHDAGAAVRWTLGAVPESTIAALRGLSPSGARAGVELYHGSIRDPVWEYVVDDRTAATCLELQGSPFALIGHSHVALVYGYLGGKFLGGLAPDGTRIELGEGPFLLNPGSVGQPRDGDPRAAFLELDLEARVATWRRVAYDIDRTRQAIDRAGLPHRLGARLYQGR
jgi:diadenosine tetraphosphatase ApaH/serine/threonine PP2A family protein phosphatase